MGAEFGALVNDAVPRPRALHLACPSPCALRHIACRSTHRSQRMGSAGDDFKSAMTAVAVVHLVLFGYVIAALTEDAGDPPVPPHISKRQQ